MQHESRPQPDPPAPSVSRERPSPRSLGDDELVAALVADGCPLCSHVASVAPRYLESLLYQHTTDRAYRDRFTSGGGFCPRHVRAAMVADAAGNGDGVGGAIFLRSMLGSRHRALREVGNFRAASRIRAATRPAWDCPVCENERTLAASAAQRLVEHAAQDQAWRGWVADAAWCLAHAGDVLAAAASGRGDPLQALRARQSELMADLEQRLDALIHDSSHGRREQLTPEVREALSQVVELLAGNE